MIFALVADDHPDAALLALRGCGVECFAAHDADTTLAALRACRPDAVVLDLMLPGAPDPRAFAADVRALFPDGRIVVASGADPRDVCQIADAIGAIPLPKPHLRAGLVRAVTGDSL
ncbi:MAG: response regulator transcription factor [Myxococcales bacterium]|nr:response regulator transcription factor [Myxococcales bacterium]